MVRLPKASAIAVLVAVAAAAGIWSVAGAQSQAYKFEAVSDEISVGEGVRIEVRLLDPSGKPVPAGVIDIVSTRLDMGPDGMAMMDTPLTPVPVDSADVMAFETKIVMAGRWALTIEVEVDGVPAPVKGVVIYTAVEKKPMQPCRVSGRGPKDTLLPQPDGPARHIAGAEEGLDGNGLHSCLRGRTGGHRRNRPRQCRKDAARRRQDRGGRASRSRPLDPGAGTVMADEARVALVTARFDGFVERLDVRTTGGAVTAGEPLLRAWIESDELLRKQADYLSALSRGGRDVERAAQNLRLFGISDATIAEMARTRVPARVVTFEAPQAGTILDKPALDGMRFAAGDTLFRIADLSSLWVMAEIAEQDLALVKPGQTAQLSMPAMPGEMRAAIVDFVYPDIDRTTRSGRVRLVVPNADGRLKLGHFVRVEIGAPVGDKPALAVPVASVIDDGARQIVFVARGDGLFEPRDVRLGARAGADVEIREGLAAGEEIVTSGIFLIDAESNLQTALSVFTTEAAAP